MDLQGQDPSGTEIRWALEDGQVDKMESLDALFWLSKRTSS